MRDFFFFKEKKYYQWANVSHSAEFITVYIQFWKSNLNLMPTFKHLEMSHKSKSLALRSLAFLHDSNWLEESSAVPFRPCTRVKSPPSLLHFFPYHAWSCRHCSLEPLTEITLSTFPLRHCTQTSIFSFLGPILILWSENHLIKQIHLLRVNGWWFA